MKHTKDKFYELLEDYFNNYLPVAKGLSVATITSYKATFRLLIEYIFKVKNITAEKISFSVLTIECIQGFLEWLETERKCSVSTRNQRLSAIVAFAQYAQIRDFGNAILFFSFILCLYSPIIILMCDKYSATFHHLSPP